MSARRTERAEARRRADLSRATLAARPDDAVALHNLAVALRALGETDEALGSLAPVMRGPARAETRLLHAHLLHDKGDYGAAIAAYRAIIADEPGQVDAHATLSRLLPQVGARDAALDSYRAALTRTPEAGVLWMSALQAAHDLGDTGQLIAWADAAERRFGRDTVISVFVGMALMKTGEDARAHALLAEAVRGEPDYVPARTALACALIRAGAPGEAEVHALHAARLAPDDQLAWALLTAIWRLTGDAREAWLADYDRLVIAVTLDIDVAAVAAALSALHDTGGEPADQSLRGGTQTRGDLHRRAEPAIQTLMDAIETGVESALATLPADPRHPFLRRNTGRIAFGGSWSVQLARAGFHVAHIHPAGWISSALHVALPPLDVITGEGALVFGVPDAMLGLDLPPRRTSAPVAGRLIIFPSYFWHGTRPFASDVPRLSLAFDAVPAR